MGVSDGSGWLLKSGNDKIVANLEKKKIIRNIFWFEIEDWEDLPIQNRTSYEVNISDEEELISAQV